MKGGYGLNRRSFASNSFEIVGPANDPAGVANMTPENAFATLLLKGTNNTPNVYFVSRGDGSGTQTAEINIWSKAGYNYTQNVEKSGSWYIESGQGMGATLQMASEKGAYALTDEGTFLAYKSNLTLVPVVTKGGSLLNIYSVMAVYNANQPVEKIQMANNFINFLISPQTQADIGNFGVQQYGKSLFTPMDVSVPNASAGWVGDHTYPGNGSYPCTHCSSHNGRCSQFNTSSECNCRCTIILPFLPVPVIPVAVLLLKNVRHKTVFALAFTCSCTCRKHENASSGHIQQSSVAKKE